MFTESEILYYKARRLRTVSMGVRVPIDYGSLNGPGYGGRGLLLLYVVGTVKRTLGFQHPWLAKKLGDKHLMKEARMG